MIRNIVCEACTSREAQLTDVDRSMGYRLRKRWILAKKPKDHHITIDGKRYPSDMRCDTCGSDIDGEFACAHTLWRESDGTPPDWETEYGFVVPEQAVRLADKLKK